MQAKLSIQNFNFQFDCFIGSRAPDSFKINFQPTTLIQKTKIPFFHLKVLNVSISSSPINSKPPTSSPIIYQPSPSINIHPIPHQQQQLPSLQQQQLNLNRLNYLLAIQKQQQQNKNLFSAFLNCNGIINNQNNEQLQQPIFSCNLCPQKFTNQVRILF
ncbi:unnamed protein product [Meloidogyne enterolobii]|uniref:Uncharacterized protein n=1 Tax=Meloidogyne enterolobii TaxID=390850 RepID=A0ACB0Y4N6_MELEN